MKAKLALALAGTALIAGCNITPEQYETTPVVLSTAQGPVTCQLYQLDQVTWDRAIHRPNAMSVETADTLCRNAGARILGEGTGWLVQDGNVLRAAQPL